VLIKPDAAYSAPYPVTTSRKLLTSIIEGIRKVSDADIVVLEGRTAANLSRRYIRSLAIISRGY